eukprot:CFRG2712T1
MNVRIKLILAVMAMTAATGTIGLPTRESTSTRMTDAQIVNISSPPLSVPGPPGPGGLPTRKSTSTRTTDAQIVDISPPSVPGPLGPVHSKLFYLISS